MSVNPCRICGAAVDFERGGAAIMLAFCRGHSTTLTNVAYCAECYKTVVHDDLSRLNANSNLGIDFGGQEPPKEET